MNKQMKNGDMLKASVPERIGYVADIATKLGLGNVITINYDIHKAHKGERITTPHLNPAIWELEKQMFALFQPRQIITEVLKGIGIGQHYWKSMLRKSKSIKIYNQKGQALSDEDLLKLEKVIADALHIPIKKVHEIILKSALVSKLSAEKLMGQAIKIDLSALPKTLKEAIKTASLTAREVRAIKFAWNYAGINVTMVQDRAKALIKRAVVDGLMDRTHPRALANKMYNELAIGDASLLNRDWERVAITETNRSANDGYIAGRPDGSYVLGNSHGDACPYCLRYINNQIYKVTTDPPDDYSDLDSESKEYQDLAKRWDTEIWVGKSNVSRSLSARKRVDGKLKPREHHERAAPTLPLHPICRCRWSSWLPELYYLKNGRVEFAVDEKSKAEHAEFLKRNPHIAATGK